MKKIYFTFLISLVLIASSFSQNAWLQKTSMPAPSGAFAAAFVLMGNAYINDVNGNFWKYDPFADTWTQLPGYPGGFRGEAIAFAIGNFGYLGGGFEAHAKQDFYRFDVVNNTWTQKSDLPGIRGAAVGFSIGTKGYFGTGYDGFYYHDDFYQYDPALDSWTQLANFPGGMRSESAVFVIDTVAYVLAGKTDFSTYHNDCWAFTPALNSWSARASLPGNIRIRPAAFSIYGFGWAGLGAYGPSFYGTYSLFDYPVISKSI